MSITIGKSIAALQAQQRLNKTNQRLESVFERLSSGMRINRASDDAAGLAIGTRLQADARLSRQASRNVNDAISTLQIVDSSLAALNEITLRQVELATQAANGAYSLKQRKAMDEEATALTEEYNRIIEATEFNGLQLLDGSLSEIVIQTGTTGTDNLQLELNSGLARIVGTGEFTSITGAPTSNGVSGVQAADLNGDGAIDIMGSVYNSSAIAIGLGNGDGTFGAVTYLTPGGNPRDVTSLDLNADGHIDIVAALQANNEIAVFLGNGDGTFQARTTYATSGQAFDIEVGDINGDNLEDIIVANLHTASTADVFISQGDGTVTNAISYTDTGSNNISVYAGDVTGDGLGDLVMSAYHGGNNALRIAIGNGDGTFKAATILESGSRVREVEFGDFNNDNVLDIASIEQDDATASIYFGNGDGTFANRVVYDVGAVPRGLDVGDLNNDGIDDLLVGNDGHNTIQSLVSNGDGTFTVGTPASSPDVGLRLTTADINNDGVLDALTGSSGAASQIILFLGETTTSTFAEHIHLVNTDGARAALDTLDARLQRLSNTRSSIGAQQSRLAVNVSYLQEKTTLLHEAASRILDADIAQEAAELVRLKVLQDAGAAILGQANLQSQIVLSLL